MDQAYSRQSEDFPPVVTALAGAIRTDQVIGDPESCGVYSNDAYTTARQLPMCVVLPESTQDVVAIVNTCREFNTPLVTRGLGLAYPVAHPASRSRADGHQPNATYGHAPRPTDVGRTRRS